MCGHGCVVCVAWLCDHGCVNPERVWTWLFGQGCVLTGCALIAVPLVPLLPLRGVKLPLLRALWLFVCGVLRVWVWLGRL